ncbi:MAG: 23S rRNA (adenine(2503)-C(2))-methyltransferase RlmN [Candidatus Aminicenantes bacterium]|nr:23S rRNA (adenine(2503)-C(2))-methyltransferase RlmN [Candidatus Aminicenantes bacterium]
MNDIRDLTREELATELAAMGEPAFRAGQVFAWLYARGARSFDDFTDLPKGLRLKLAGRFGLRPLEAEGVLRARDGTEKVLFRLRDGWGIETVVIPAGERRTLCLSTQAGCKFACAFCASGGHGFKRDLVPSEIVGQVLHVRASGPGDLTNLVFMGMGEPLDNYDNFVRAIRILNDPEGMGIAARRMTISTSGFVPGILRLAELGLQVNLSISLHAADDGIRSRLMPINRRYPLAELLAAVRRYLSLGGRKITFEYVLIAGVNDRLSDADGLARLGRRFRAKINLIPYSPVEGFDFRRPSPERTRAFLRRLEEKGASATLRRSKGGDIRAACGQLAGRF